MTLRQVLLYMFDRLKSALDPRTVPLTILDSSYCIELCASWMHTGSTEVYLHPLLTMILSHGSPTSLCQTGSPIIVGWFAGFMWKNNGDLPDHLNYCVKFCSVHTKYKCGCGPNNTTCQAACWRTMHYMEVSVQLHILAALFLGKETPVPIEWEAGWDPELVWVFWR
jgi:hypothetical protein